jgi:hypothetical protein
MKKITLITLLLISTLSINAQGYKSALGLRMNNYYGGLTYKYFIAPTTAWDLTLSTEFNSGATVTALYEKHVSIADAPGLSWYYGPGFHVGLWGNGNNATVDLGIDGVVGLEYVVKEIPFAFSLDYIPSINLRISDKDGGVSPFFGNWSLGVKYTFGKVILTSK